MRAVAYDGFRQQPDVRDLPEPTPAPHGCVIAVEATGLCRSDWHGWMGHDPDIRRFPHVPGHELAGVVEAVGDRVERWTPGARVTIPFVCACGTCPQCLAGDHQICDRQTQPGFTHWGSFAELAAIDWADVNLVALPDGLEYDDAAALGCRFATAYRAVVAHGRVRPGMSVAVHGCGGVGLAAVMIAAAHGAEVVAVDISEAALDLAREFGAAHTELPPSASRLVERGGVHVSIDALGRIDTFADAIAGLRRRGRHVQVGLLVGTEARPPVDMAAVIGRELEIVGSHGMAAHDYPPMLAEIAVGRLDPRRLVTNVISLDEAPAALMAMSHGSTPGTTVVDLSASHSDRGAW